MDTYINERFHAYLTGLLQVSKVVGHFSHISTLAKKHKVAAIPLSRTAEYGLDDLLRREAPVTREESDAIRQRLCDSWRKTGQDGNAPTMFDASSVATTPFDHWWEKEVPVTVPTNKYERRELQRALYACNKRWDDEEMAVVPWRPEDVAWAIVCNGEIGPECFEVEERTESELDYIYEDGYQILFPTEELAEAACQWLNEMMAFCFQHFYPPQPKECSNE